MGTNDDFTTPAISTWERHHLKRGCKYRVKRLFTDADGNRHPVGEEWIFLGSKFSRFEDEYFLYVRFEPNEAQSLRLNCDLGQQDEIVKHFKEYVEEA